MDRRSRRKGLERVSVERYNDEVLAVLETPEDVAQTWSTGMSVETVSAASPLGNLTCERCGQVFRQKWKSYTPRFCSHKCASIVVNGNRSKTFPCECRCCHKTYLPKAPNRNKFCSRECSFERRRGISAKRQLAVAERASRWREEQYMRWGEVPDAWRRAIQRMAKRGKSFESDPWKAKCSMWACLLKHRRKTRGKPDRRVRCEVWGKAIHREVERLRAEYERSTDNAERPWLRWARSVASAWSMRVRIA